MFAKDAKAIARQWVADEFAQIPGFMGAFLHGSINWLADDEIIAATSDLDVMVVLDNPPLDKLGKFVHQNLLIEISYIPTENLQSAQQVLDQYPIVGGFRKPDSIIADPTGHLTRLQEQIGPQYARRPQVVARCEAARAKVRRGVALENRSGPFHEQVTAWLFSAGLTTHILLNAGLKNPTVRRRYVAARELLEEYGLGDFQETLLALMGAGDVTASATEAHLNALSAAFDDAGRVLNTPYQFAADMRRDARPVAIDGSRELIGQGSHREALFWITAVYSRCMHVLTVDAPPEMVERHAVGYQRLVAELGVAGPEGLANGRMLIKAKLPEIWAVAEEIMDRNPDVVD